MSGFPLAAVGKYLGRSSAQIVIRFSRLVPEVSAHAVDAAMSFSVKPDK
jgi:hypothetical protein